MNACDQSVATGGGEQQEEKTRLERKNKADPQPARPRPSRFFFFLSAIRRKEKQTVLVYVARVNDSPYAPTGPLPGSFFKIFGRHHGWALP